MFWVSAQKVGSDMFINCLAGKIIYFIFCLSIKTGDTASRKKYECDSGIYTEITAYVENLYWLKALHFKGDMGYWAHK